jgi:hypothetical protein
VSAPLVTGETTTVGQIDSALRDYMTVVTCTPHALPGVRWHASATPMDYSTGCRHGYGHTLGEALSALLSEIPPVSR